MKPVLRNPASKVFISNDLMTLDGSFKIVNNGNPMYLNGKTTVEIDPLTQIINTGGNFSKGPGVEPFDDIMNPIASGEDKEFSEIVKQQQQYKKLWDQTFQKVGSMNNYPRPQGNLPMFPWGLTDSATNDLNKYYQGVAFSGFR
jgi:hypothetical protein